MRAFCRRRLVATPRSWRSRACSRRPPRSPRGVDGGVPAIRAVVAQGRLDEGIGGKVVDVELAVGADLGVAEVMVVVAPGPIRVRSEVIETGNMLGGVAAGRAARGRALDVVAG